MIISLRRWIRWSKFILCFIVGTLLLYQLIVCLKPWFYPDLWRDTPGDGAVKVLSFMDQSREQQLGFVEHVKNRLLIYYWLDE